MGGLSMLLLAGEHALTNKEAGYKLMFDQSSYFHDVLELSRLTQYRFVP